MVQRDTGWGTAAAWWQRWAYRGVVCFGLVGGALTWRDVAAQLTAHPSLMTTRPHEMATAARTTRAGEHALDTLSTYRVYVPLRCVGARRCPLVVFLSGFNDTTALRLASQRAFADRYGMILLAPTLMAEQEAQTLDTALQAVLRAYAIDPDRIALVGYGPGLQPGASGSYSPTLLLGLANPALFSRVAQVSSFTIDSVSRTVPFAPPDRRVRARSVPPSRAPARHQVPGPLQVYLSLGLGAGFQLWQVTTLINKIIAKDTVPYLRGLRLAGYPVEPVLALSGYVGRWDEYDRLWQWLEESWTPAGVPPVKAIAADSLAVLTPEAVTKLTTFWSRFVREPEAIRTTARLAYQRRLSVPIGAEQLSLWLVDMPALAARSPAVAADLRHAGLTAQQHDAYRIALIATAAAWQTTLYAMPDAPTSVLERNMTFLGTHRRELLALGATGMWTIP